VLRPIRDCLVVKQKIFTNESTPDGFGTGEAQMVELLEAVKETGACKTFEPDFYVPIMAKAAAAVEFCPAVNRVEPSRKAILTAIRQPVVVGRHGERSLRQARRLGEDRRRRGTLGP
jgi:hypothetical protein